MAHTQQQKDKILARIKKLQGQLGSVASAIESEADCYKVLQILASSRGALQGLMGEIVEGHIRDHVVNAKNSKEATLAAEETVEIMKSFWK
jgi:DNA-binding FrmR family transcriptional regulator